MKVLLEMFLAVKLQSLGVALVFILGKKFLSALSS